jgi:hypothetical protein
MSGCFGHEHESEHLALHKKHAISFLCTELLIAGTLLHRVFSDDSGGCCSGSSSSSKKGVFPAQKGIQGE